MRYSWPKTLRNVCNVGADRNISKEGKDNLHISICEVMPCRGKQIQVFNILPPLPQPIPLPHSYTNLQGQRLEGNTHVTVHIGWRTLDNTHCPSPPHTKNFDVGYQVRQRVGIWLWLHFIKRKKDKLIRELKVETEQLRKFLAAISREKISSTGNKAFGCSWLGLRCHPDWFLRSEIQKWQTLQ